MAKGEEDGGKVEKVRFVRVEGVEYMELEPRPGRKARRRCWPVWLRSHKLQLTVSAIGGGVGPAMYWRCKRCTGKFSKVSVRG